MGNRNLPWTTATVCLPIFCYHHVSDKAYRSVQPFIVDSLLEPRGDIDMHLFYCMTQSYWRCLSRISAGGTLCEGGELDRSVSKNIVAYVYLLLRSTSLLPTAVWRRLLSTLISRTEIFKAHLPEHQHQTTWKSPPPVHHNSHPIM